MKLSEKVAYLKGLEEGLNLDSGKAETKLIKGIIEAFDEIVEAIDVNTTDIQEMTERVDEIDMDLGDLEAILFEGFEVEELTEEDLADFEDDDDAFAVVYTSDADPVDEVEEEVVEEAVEEAVEEEAPVEEVAEVEEAVEEEAPVDVAPIEEARAEQEVVEVEEELDDEAIFAAADEVVAEAEAAEAAEEAEETVESVFDEAPVEEARAEHEVKEVAAPAAAAAAATGIAWPDEEVAEVEEAVEEVVEEAPVAEPVEEVIEREAEPEEDTYEVECPTCGHVMYVDESVLAQGGIECPKCHESLQFEIEYED